jgi:hypothetical protein
MFTESVIALDGLTIVCHELPFTLMVSFPAASFEVMTLYVNTRPVLSVFLVVPKRGDVDCANIENDSATRNKRETSFFIVVGFLRLKMSRDCSRLLFCLCGLGCVQY